MSELRWLTDAVESGDIQPGFVCMVLKHLHERDTEIERLKGDVAEREKAATWLGGKLARREIDDEWALEALRRWPWL